MVMISMKVLVVAMVVVIAMMLVGGGDSLMGRSDNNGDVNEDGGWCR